MVEDGSIPGESKTFAKYIIDDFPTEEKFMEWWIETELEDFYNRARNRWNKSNKSRRDIVFLK